MKNLSREIRLRSVQLNSFLLLGEDMNEMGGEGQRAATGGRIPARLGYELCSGEPTARQFKLSMETKADKIPTAKRKCDYRPDPAPCLLQCVYAEWLTLSAKLRGTYRGI